MKSGFALSKTQALSKKKCLGTQSIHCSREANQDHSLASYKTSAVWIY